MKFTLSLDLKSVLPILRAAQVYVFGALLVGAFAYTAYVVNASLNVQPAASAPAASPAVEAIKFDQKAITALKNLSSVDGTVPTGTLGTSDPFR
ncbi:MAG TPA: hypothetical protein VI322_02320 [Candidatus Saccharimonadia bacterium]